MATIQKPLRLSQSGAKRSASALSSMRVAKWREAAIGYLFLAPSLVLFAVFLFYPLLKSVYLSFQLTDPRGRVVEYTGLDNYAELFADAKFLSSLNTSFLFTLYTVPTVIAAALALAALTHNRLQGMKAFQFVFSLPLAISVSTGAVIWNLLFHPSLGMLNYALQSLGLPPVMWLTDPSIALFSVSGMTVWMNLGFAFIVLVSGLQGIPEELYESARIDGSSPWRTFRAITIPLLSPTLFFLSTVSVIGALQAFGQIHILTKGGPTGATDVFVYHIYQEAFVNFRFGSGSAQALVLFALILLLTLVQFKVLEKKVHYQ